MPRGRKPSLTPHKRLNVYVDSDLYAKFQILYFDNRLQRPSFGAFSELVNQFLRQHLNEKEKTLEEVK